MSGLHPIFEQALAPFLKPIATRNGPVDEDEVERPDDYDPTPWCSGCGARKKSACHCGPIAENE